MVFDRHVHENLGQQYHHRSDVLRWIPGDVQSILLDVVSAGNHHHRYCVCILNVGSGSGYNHLSYDGATIESWLELCLSSSSSIGISIVNSSLFIDLALQIRCALELFLISLSISSSPCVFCRLFAFVIFVYSIKELTSQSFHPSPWLWKKLKISVYLQQNTTWNITATHLMVAESDRTIDRIIECTVQTMCADRSELNTEKTHSLFEQYCGIFNLVSMFCTSETRFLRLSILSEMTELRQINERSVSEIDSYPENAWSASGTDAAHDRFVPTIHDAILSPQGWPFSVVSTKESRVNSDSYRNLPRRS